MLMAPSIEKTGETIRKLALEREIERDLKRRQKVELYYLNTLKKGAKDNLDALYGNNLYISDCASVIAMDKTFVDLKEVRQNETGEGWRILRDIRQEAVSQIVDYFPEENPEYLHYSPFAFYYDSSYSEKMFLALEVDSNNAKKYLADRYNALLREKASLINNPDEWNPVFGDLQLARAYNWYHKSREVEPSLIVSCDITETQFGHDYIKVMKNLEE
jgi:hypothetical protein